jgi:arsenical resistance protein ArsH
MCRFTLSSTLFMKQTLSLGRSIPKTCHCAIAIINHRTSTFTTAISPHQLEWNVKNQTSRCACIRNLPFPKKRVINRSKIIGLLVSTTATITVSTRFVTAATFLTNTAYPLFGGISSSRSREYVGIHGNNIVRAGSTMTESFDIDLWNGKDKERFDSLNHPGCTIHSDPTTHMGGWYAHRWDSQQTYNTSDTGTTNDQDQTDWILNDVAPYISKFDYTSMPIGRPPNILVLYGSLRQSSYSRKMAYEFARLLELLGCNVRVYNPMGLPLRNPDNNGEGHVKVVEIRALTQWSDGHVWVSPEMHGTITGIFKNQIDWIPLNTGSVRPTQGKTCCVAQVNGGSQSFNAVNALRLLARWMRMPCCTNQSSVPKAWQEFDDTIGGRMKPSDYRNHVVDVAEEFAKFTAVMVPVSDQLTDRYSERIEVMKEGRLLSQEEKVKKQKV